MRRQVPLLITFIVGTVLIFSVFLPPMEGWGENFTLFFDIIAVFAFFLGGGNLLRVHIAKLSKKRPDWQFSIVTIVGFLTISPIHGCPRYWFNIPPFPRNREQINNEPLQENHLWRMRIGPWHTYLIELRHLSLNLL